ncbi:MAG: HD domain-containing phosphohydrolase, partial [Candidatus Omnitrophota bacterium]
MRHSILKKIAIALIASFTVQEMSYAQGGMSPKSPRSVQEIRIPGSLGFLGEKRVTASSETILHIQDAHDSLEAQKKITEILNVLARDYEVTSVALEGSSGAVDPLLFKTVPDQALAKESAEALMKEGHLNAGEFFAITSEKPVSVYGVEEKALYRKNLKAFKGLLEKREKIAGDLKGLERTLEVLGERVYGEEAKRIRANALFREGAYSFTKRWESLRTLAQDKNIRLNVYPNLQILSKVTDLENAIHFKKANDERRQLLSLFREILKGPDLAEVVEKSLAFKAGKVSDVQFHEWLRDAAARHGLDLSSTPNLERYTRYLVLFGSMDLYRLIGELGDLEERTKEAYFTSSDERDLNALEKNFKILSNLVSGTASSKEFETFLADRHADARESFLRLSQKYHVPLYGAKLENILSVLPDAVRFYGLARQRDEILIRNTLKKMRAQNQTVAALVTGGFHAEGISNILKDQGLSYLIVLPKITDPADKRPYLAVLTRKPEKVAKALGSETSRFKIAWGSGLGNPYAGLRDLLAPLVERIKKGPEAPARLRRWMARYRRGYDTKGNEKDPRLHPDRIEKMVTEMAGARLATASGLAEKNWLEENTPELFGKKIVEVTMEMALSHEMLARLEEKLKHDPSLTEGARDQEMRKAAMATSVGGIGPLLKERVIAQAELGAHVTGVSFLYDQVWVQKVNEEGALILEKQSVTGHLKEILEAAGEISIEMYDGAEARVKVWKAPSGTYGKGEVYFFDVPSVTDDVTRGRANVVYPGSRDVEMAEEARFHQSWVLGRGALALMKKLDRRPDLIIMSEWTSMFVHPKVFRDKFSEDPFFGGTRTVFNDHTPLEYAHPLWKLDTLKKLRVDPRYYEDVPIWTTNGLDATALMINAADGVYGVAEKHRKVMQEMEILKRFKEKIQSVTNGVNQDYWPHDELKDLSKINELSDRELLTVKDRRRAEFIRWLSKRQGLGEAWAEKMIAGKNPVGVWTRRIVEYKRLELFADILADEAMKGKFLKTGIIFVVGGRIHQDDPYGLKQYRRITEAIHKDPRLKERVIFFENYNIWEAPRIFQGADFSVMLADDGREASATGFQKAQMNGALIIASDDGAVPESVTFYSSRSADQANGFEVPFKEKKPTARGFLNAMIRFTFVYSQKETLAKMTRNALRQTSRVSARRTAEDMLRIFAGWQKRFDGEAEAIQEGRKAVQAAFHKAPISSPTAREVLSALNRDPARFLWKYKDRMMDEKVLKESDGGLKGFVEGIRYLRTLGTIGQWSLEFHAENSDGRGDILTYLRDHLLRDVPYLDPVKEEVEKLGRQFQASKDPRAKVRFNLTAMAMADELLLRLETAALGARLALTEPEIVQGLKRTNRKMRVAVARELLADQSSVDVLVVTAFDERMKKIYEEHIASLRGVILRKDLPVLVVTNPSGKEGAVNVGNGGMLARSLRAVEVAFFPRKPADLRIGLIQAGGQGDRMVLSGIMGAKPLVPLPVKLPNGKNAVLLDLALMALPFFSRALAEKGLPGIINFSGDVTLISEASLADGINLIVSPKKTSEVLNRFGVIAFDGAGRVVFREKPSEETLKTDPLLAGKEFHLANTAASIMIHRDAQARQSYVEALLEIEALIERTAEAGLPVHVVDTSRDLLESLTLSLEEYLQRRGAKEGGRRDFYAEIYRILRREHFPGLVVTPPAPDQSYFVDFGTLEDWLKAVSPESVFSRVEGRSVFKISLEKAGEAAAQSSLSGLFELEPNAANWRYVILSDAFTVKIGPDNKVESEDLRGARMAQNILPDAIRHEFADALHLAPVLPAGHQYGGNTYYPQGRLIPRSKDIQTIDEEKALALLLDPRPGVRAVLTRDYNEMTYLTLYLGMKLMDAAQREFSIGLATGGTTESLRKAMGIAELIDSVFHNFLKAHKVKAVTTLDDYYWPIDADRRIHALACYREEQLYMMLRNLFHQRSEEEIQKLFVSPPVFTPTIQEAERVFREKERQYLDVAYRLLVQFHGIGTLGHDAFNEVMTDLLLATGGLRWDLRKILAVPAGLERVTQRRELLRPDHAVRLSEVTRVQNIGHFLKKGFHPFFLRFMGDNRLANLDDLIDALSRFGVTEMLEYYPEKKYQFLSEEEFIKEFQYLLDHYSRTPAEALTQGTGDILLRTFNPDSVNMFMVSGPHKAEALRRSLELGPNESATASWMHLAPNSVVIVSEDAASRIDQGKLFRFEPTNADYSLITEKKVDGAWRDTDEGRRVAELLKASHGARLAKAPTDLASWRDFLRDRPVAVIVDDNRHWLDEAAGYLAAGGFKVVRAQSLSDAKAQLKRLKRERRRVEYVISDLDLGPRFWNKLHALDGLWLVRFVRREFPEARTRLHTAIKNGKYGGKFLYKLQRLALRGIERVFQVDIRPKEEIYGRWQKDAEMRRLRQAAAGTQKAEEAGREILTLWHSLGEEVSDNPFHPQVQEVYRRILALSDPLNSKEMLSLGLEQRYGIFWSELYGRGDHGRILKWFREKSSLPAEEPGRKFLLYEPKLASFRALYYLAKAMDPQSVRHLNDHKHTGYSFLRVFGSELYGVGLGRFDALIRETPDLYPNDEMAAGLMLNLLTMFTEFYRESGRFDDALRTWENFSSLALFSKPSIPGFSLQPDDLLRIREDILKERQKALESRPANIGRGARLAAAGGLAQNGEFAEGKEAVGRILAASPALLKAMKRLPLWVRLNQARAAHNAVLVGQAMNFPPSFLRALYVAGYFHDVGKSDPHILPLVRKPGKLDPQEFGLVQNHPSVGADRLEAVEESVFEGAGVSKKTVVEAIRAHHENFDGTGYPRRLKERSIPVAAAIIHVVDAFDAMTDERRVYQKTKSFKEACEELIRFRKTQFDPEFVDKFLSIAVTPEAIAFPPSASGARLATLSGRKGPNGKIVELKIGNEKIRARDEKGLAKRLNGWVKKGLIPSKFAFQPSESSTQICVIKTALSGDIKTETSRHLFWSDVEGLIKILNSDHDFKIISSNGSKHGARLAVFQNPARDRTIADAPAFDDRNIAAFMAWYDAQTSKTLPDSENPNHKIGPGRAARFLALAGKVHGSVETLATKAKAYDRARVERGTILGEIRRIWKPPLKDSYAWPLDRLKAQFDVTKITGTVFEPVSPAYRNLILEFAYEFYGREFLKKELGVGKTPKSMPPYVYQATDRLFVVRDDLLLKKGYVTTPRYSTLQYTDQVKKAAGTWDCPPPAASYLAGLYGSLALEMVSLTALREGVEKAVSLIQEGRARGALESSSQGSQDQLWNFWQAIPKEGFPPAALASPEEEWSRAMAAFASMEYKDFKTRLDNLHMDWAAHDLDRVRIDRIFGKLRTASQVAKEERLLLEDVRREISSGLPAGQAGARLAGKSYLDHVPEKEAQETIDQLGNQWALNGMGGFLPQFQLPAYNYLIGEAGLKETVKAIRGRGAFPMPKDFLAVFLVATKTAAAYFAQDQRDFLLGFLSTWMRDKEVYRHVELFARKFGPPDDKKFLADTKQIFDSARKEVFLVTTSFPYDPPSKDPKVVVEKGHFDYKRIAEFYLRNKQFVRLVFRRKNAILTRDEKKVLRRTVLRKIITKPKRKPQDFDQIHHETGIPSMDLPGDHYTALRKVAGEAAFESRSFKYKINSKHLDRESVLKLGPFTGFGTLLVLRDLKIETVADLLEKTPEEIYEKGQWSFQHLPVEELRERLAKHGLSLKGARLATALQERVRIAVDLRQIKHEYARSASANQAVVTALGEIERELERKTISLKVAYAWLGYLLGRDPAVALEGIRTRLKKNIPTDDLPRTGAEADGADKLREALEHLGIARDLIARTLEGPFGQMDTLIGT